jgi:hypothetical protein
MGENAGERKDNSTEAENTLWKNLWKNLWKILTLNLSKLP